MKKFIYVWMMFAFVLMVAGNVMASVSLNGSQHLSVMSSTGLSITGNNSISFYVKPSAQPATNTIMGIINKDDLSSQRSYNLFYMDENGTKKIKLFFSQTLTASQYSISSWSYTIPTNAWTYIEIPTTITNPSSTKCLLYINGVSQGYGSPTEVGGGATSIAAGTANLEIGRFSNGTNYFSGLIADVRLYNYARSGIEIFNSYKKSPSGTESGLVTSWPLANSFSGIGSYTSTLTNNGGATFSTDVPYITETVTPVTETPVTVTPSASNPITTVINQAVAIGLSVGTNQQYLVVGKDASNAYHLAIAETTGTFIKSVTLTSGYIPVSVTQVISGGTASTTQVSVLSTNAGKYYNLLINTSTGTITPVAW